MNEPIKTENTDIMSIYQKSENILSDIQNIIETSQWQAYHAVDTILSQRNRLIGYRISEEEIDGSDRAEYDELKKGADDNPTLGIVLCTETDEDIARYSVLHGNEQLFASKYKLYLPTEEELRKEIEIQKTMFYLQQKEKQSGQKHSLEN